MGSLAKKLSSGSGEWIIYHLIDPDTKAVRYVGITSQKLEQRFYNHLWDARKTKASRRTLNWIRKLGRQGKIPIAVEVSRGCGVSWAEAEKAEIEKQKSLGCDLTNHSLGGEGNGGYRHTEETKKLLSDKTKAAWARGELVRKHTPESVQRMSDAQRGRVVRPESVIKQKETKRKKDEIGNNIELLTTLYESGLTVEKIAEKLDRKFGTIYGRMRRAGVKMRPPVAPVPARKTK